jgi:regulator of replication initiation timing
MQQTSAHSQRLLFFSIIVLLSFAFLRTYIRIQTTLTSYEIGELKEKESKLLEENAFLRMELAKISTKKSLLELSRKAIEMSPQ